VDRAGLNEGLRLVKKIALRMSRGLPSYLDKSELVAAGNEGLAKAIRTFDEAKGVPFGAYATLKIRGSILDSLRKKDPLTRDQRANKNILDEYVDAHIAKQGKAPQAEQAAKDTGIEVGQVTFLMSNPDSTLYIQDYVSSDGNLLLEDRLAEHAERRQAMCAMEMSHCVREILSRLPEPDRELLKKYYLEERPYREIGEQMGVTETRAYQKVRSSVKKAGRVASRLFWDLDSL